MKIVKGEKNEKLNKIPINMDQGFRDGLRRSIDFEYDLNKDSELGIVTELIKQGLLSKKDKSIVVAQLGNSLQDV